MQSNRVPPEDPSRKRQEIVSQRIPFEIGQYNSPPRDSSKVPQQLNNMVVGKMVQEQRAVDKIEAAFPERHAKSIAAHARTARTSHVAEVVIEGRQSGIGIFSLDTSPHVSGRGAYIE